MAYDDGLVQRIREVFADRTDLADQVVEKKMFGGLAFMVRGHMTVGVTDDRLMARVGADGHAEALARPHVQPMDFTGRPLKGFVFVEPEGVAEDADLSAWVDRALAFTSSLPAK